MGRHTRAMTAASQAADARRLMDLATVPPPPGAVPLDLPAYDATKNSWLQPEFVAWNNASEADRRSGAWRNAVAPADPLTARKQELNAAGSARTAPVTFGVDYPEPSSAPPPELPPQFYDSAGYTDPSRYVTREPYADAQAEPYADTGELADAGGLFGFSWTEIAIGAGLFLGALALYRTR